jgi:hypothetical protein
MAQESRITSFEKALKDEGIAGTNLESVARSIFQQESSSGANVKTSNAGARGPMQVLPATFKAYNPQGNIDDPYDNSVGGLRYIKDLFSKTNDLGLTAVGYYGGPKAIEKAKQGVAVSDPRNPNAPNTLQYMEQVMGRTKGSQPQPAPRGNKPPVNPLIKQKITDLGPSYQAALALMAKADDLNEAREKIAEEEELASAGADFSQAKQMLAQIKPTSPFPAQEPRRMAKGGEAKTEEGLDPSLRFQSLDTPKDLEPGIMQQGPQGVMGRAGFNYQGEDSRFRAGASAIAVKLPDGSIKIIPAAYDVGYSTRVGPGELELSANRAIKAMPGRNPEWGARVNYRIPIGKAEGGEVEKKPEPSMGEKVKGTAKEILRSTQYTPYDLLGAPVDIINLGLKGVDYVTGSKLATEKPVGGSDYLIQKSRELGIADKPTGSTTETLTRLGTGIISPTAGPKAMAVAAEKIAAKAAPKTASRTQLDEVVAAQPPKALPAPVAAPEAAPVSAPVPSKPLVIGKMGPDEIDPAVQKQIDEIVVPTKEQKEKDRLFFGQVEKWTKSLPGKPTVQEVKNRFAKVGREYEISRLDLALQGKNPNDKVTSKELLEALKTTSPQRYRTVINEPQQGKFYQSMDNPRPSSPLGTINLLEDVNPKESLSSSVSEDLSRLKNIVTQPFFFSYRKPGDMKLLATYLRGPLIGRPDLADSVKDYEKKMVKLDDRFTTLQGDRDAHKYIYTGSSRVGLKGADEIRKAQEELLPKILQENNLDPANYRYNFELPPQIREILDERVSEAVSTKIAKGLANKYNFEFTDIPSLEKTMANLYEQARLEKQVGMTDAGRAFEDELQIAINKTSAQGPYPGQHSPITGTNNPIAFSRFLEVELPTAKEGKTKGIFVTELQSDRFDDLRKLGPKGGSVYKDIEEFNKLDQQIDTVVRQARQFLGNRNFKDLSEAEQKKYFEFGIEENKLGQRKNQLAERFNSRPDDASLYNVAEAFPGMERMPQVSQQLMIKNAVAAAIQRKNQFVLFPGADSAQAQLYEKLPFNVKAVVKDLGPGFEVKKVPMESENGDIVERLGIFWDQKAASRVAEEGVRFAKGGSVDKNDLPDQKYI